MHNPMGKKLITYVNHHFCTQNHLNKSYKEACGGIDLSIHIRGCKMDVKKDLFYILKHYFIYFTNLFNNTPNISILIFHIAQ